MQLRVWLTLHVRTGHLLNQLVWSVHTSAPVWAFRTTYRMRKKDYSHVYYITWQAFRNTFEKRYELTCDSNESRIYEGWSNILPISIIGGAVKTRFIKYIPYPSFTDDSLSGSWSVLRRGSDAQLSAGVENCSANLNSFFIWYSFCEECRFL